MLLQDKGSYRRPPKPRAPPLYCYIGMGVDRQPECITGMVVRTRGVELTAAAAVACQLLGRFFPGEAPVHVTTDRIEIGEEPWEQDTMQELVSHISSMWVPWGDVARCRNGVWDKLWATLGAAGLTLPTVAETPATADQPAVRVLEMVLLEPDMPDSGDDGDVEEITPAIPVPPAVPRPPPQRWRWDRARLGVDLGGVLLAKVPSGELRTVKTPNDVGIKMGYVPGACEWFSDCVRNYGPENVYVVSFVQNMGLREVLAEFLYAQDGLLRTTGIPGANLIWTNSRPDKRWAFVDKGLTHFIDDQVEVLVSIRAACWAQRWERRASPPALFLVPTAWANGRPSDFGRTRSDAARASEGWEEEWCIYPQITVDRVCPWDPDWATGLAAAS